MPDFPIIDSHVHLYDPSEIRFDWMAGDLLLNKPHGLVDFDNLTAGVEVDSLVFVEVDAAAGLHLKEARWVEEKIGGEPRLGGMVASMPLERGANVEADLEAFILLPHARGVRRLLERHADEPGWALQPAFVEGVRRLARFNLSFDLCLRHPQLEEATALVRACPEVRFALDHIGKPGIKAGLFERWASNLAVLAREPNVMCKISGVATEADHTSWTAPQLVPYIKHALECFGFSRAMFGGDWPVSERAIRYADWVALVDSCCAGVSSSDLRNLYGNNAAQFYRI
jgi:L-fuconolactonase